MKKIKILLALYASIQSSACTAQAVRKSLNIGNYIPEVVTQDVLNYSSPQLRLSALKGKLIILDFWGVHCSACIREMPEMQAFQEKFKDQIQVLLVTTDSKADIQKLSKTSKSFAKIKLPIVYNDHVLSELFPSTAYGLHVWIGKNGAVRYRTTGGSYTEADITDFLQGKVPALIGRDDSTKFNRYVPIWQEGGGRQMKHIQYYSYITDAITDYAGGAGALITDSITNQPVGVRFINSLILNLYVSAYQEWGKNICDSIFYDIKDSAQYFYPEDGDVYKWLLQNRVSYELLVPSTKSTELFAIMRQDLERYFDLKGQIDTVSQPYYLLSCDTSLYYQRLKSITDFNQSSLTHTVTSFHEFIDTVKKYKNADIIVDSAIKFPEKIQLPTFSSEQDLLQFLNSAGFKLTKECRKIKLLTIKECLQPNKM